MTDEKTPDSAASALSAGLGALLPCPFCGKSDTLEVITGSELMDEDPEYWQHSASYGVVCNAANPGGKGGCGAMGGFSETEAIAVAQWNTRAPNVQAQRPEGGLPPKGRAGAAGYASPDE